MELPATHRGSATSQPESITVFRVLQIGAAFCFIGHGAFGVITKEAWLPYFELVGIGPDTAFVLMPFVGWIDILVGVLALAWPTRAVFGYMAIWAVWTAALRPLAGQGIWEFFERAGNYGVPFAMLVLIGVPNGIRGWFERIRPDDALRTRPEAVARVLIVTTALLLLGHSGFGLIQAKRMLAEHYAVLGLGAAAVPAIGGFELALTLAIVLAPRAPLLGFAVAWKLATEALYPLADYAMWEFVERAGSYAAPLALTLLLTAFHARRRAWVAWTPQQGTVR